MEVSRRQVLGSAASLVGSCFLSNPSLAAPQTTNVLAQRVHQGIANGPAGSVTAEWEAANNARIEWLTYDTGPLQERLFREASLSSTTIDMAYLLNTWASPTALNLFEPLDAYQAKSPIEDFDDIFPGLKAAMTVNGKLWGIPMRHATAGLHYNEALFEERGLSGPPKTMEELIEYAKKLTYRRSDGAPVVGFVIPNNYSNIVNIARAWNGDFIDANFKVMADQPPMVKTIAVLRDLFKANAMPREFPSLMQEEAATWVQSGRAAMTITNMSRNAQFNNAERSKFPGKIKTTTVPISQELAGQFKVAPVGTEIWSYVIPRNARDKERSWSLIREMSSRKNTKIAALNGNGPVRASLYQDAEFTSKLPYAPEEARALAAARVPMPAFDGAAKAADLIREAYESAVLGYSEPEAAMQDLAVQLRRLLPN